MRSFPTLIISGDREETEKALPSLFEAGCLGIEEREETSQQLAYFPPETDLGRVLDWLRRSFPDLQWESAAPLPEEDWLAGWSKNWRGFALGRHFLILPTWETAPDTHRHILRIDPERAFGTGAHETTRLCVEFLEDYARADRAALDLGAGTGILAMVAARLGHRPVLAIEADPEAAACAEENVRRNGLDHLVEVRNRPIDQGELPSASLIVANLYDAVLRTELPRIERWLEPGGVLIVSGLFVEQVDDLVREIPAGLEAVEHRTAGGWAAVALRKAG